MRLFDTLSMEDEEVLAVDSVQKQDEVEFDSTYAAIRAKIDADAKKESEDKASSDTPEADTTDTAKATKDAPSVDSSNSDTPTDDPNNTPKEDESGVAEDKSTVNSDADEFHKEYDTTDAVSQEDWREVRDDVVGAIKDKTIDGLVYLKDIGIQYGPIVLKGIGRITLVSIVGMAKSLVLGTSLITKYFSKKINSFKRLDQEINDLKAAYELCRTNKLEIPTTEPYTDSSVISNLKIGAGAKFSENFTKGAVFVEGYLSDVDDEIKGVTAAISRLITDVVNGHGVSPNITVSDKKSFPFLELGVQSTYKPSTHLLEAFHYQSILPGDYLFIGYGPNRNISDKDEMANAYTDSKFFMGQSETSENHPSRVNLEKLEDIGKMLSEMDKLCKVCLSREAKIPQHVASRNGLKGKLNAYVRFILFAKNKSNEYDSLSHYLKNKLAFMDKTYINGEIIVHDYANRLLRYGIKYCRYALRRAK